MEVITNNQLKCTIALAALQNVTDPEIGLNVVDLGLIYQIDFEDVPPAVFVSMTLTTQFCPMGAAITSAVEKMLQNTFNGAQVNVELTFDPAWNADFISEEGQKFLNS
ncbi:MAG: metal-sulfur cluster assembly factor [Chitinophagaceae bacterium]|nr:MAG: metal-sulfur cluster assembly factor [Chitinophagaceae bacterium]